MKKSASGERAKARRDGTVRVSITVPVDDYAELKRTAESKRVSIAWVVRDAVHEYLRDQAPLLRS